MGLIAVVFLKMVRRSDQIKADLPDLYEKLQAIVAEARKASGEGCQSLAR